MKSFLYLSASLFYTFFPMAQPHKHKAKQTSPALDKAYAAVVQRQSDDTVKYSPISSCSQFFDLCMEDEMLSNFVCVCEDFMCSKSCSGWSETSWTSSSAEPKLVTSLDRTKNFKKSLNFHKFPKVIQMLFRKMIVESAPTHWWWEDHSTLSHDNPDSNRLIRITF